MNRIYNRMPDQNNAQMLVVLAQNYSHGGRHHYQPHSKQVNAYIHLSLLCNIQCTEPLLKKSIVAILVGLTFSSIFSSGPYAAITYSGDATQLISSGNVSGNLNLLLGSNTASGVIDLDANAVPIQASATVLVNYPATGTVPDFIVSGYAWLNADGTAETATSTHNAVNLIQGNILGNVYAGLVHMTSVVDGISCLQNACSSIELRTLLNNNTLIASNNKVSVQDQYAIAVAGDIYAGLAELNITYKNLNTGTLADITTTVLTNLTSWSSDANTIVIAGQGHSFANIYAGFSALNVISDDLAAGVTDDTASVNVDIKASDTTWSSSANSITILGAEHTFSDIAAGSTLIQLIYTDLTGGVAMTTSDAIAETNVSFYTNSGTWNSNNNNIAIDGTGHEFANVSAGSVAFDISTGNITTNQGVASDSNASTNSTDLSDHMNARLNSTNNSIVINGTGHTFTDISAGSTVLNIHYGDISIGSATALDTTSAFAHVATFASSDIFSSNTNHINILAENTIFHNLLAGYAGLNIQYGNITAGTTNSNAVEGFGDALLLIDVSNTSLSASNNSIILTGSSTVNGSINTGYIDFNIDFSPVKTADGDYGTTYINLAGTAATSTGNTITIEGSHHFTDTSASIYGGYLAYNSINGIAYKPIRYDVFTGNTLNYANTTPITLGEIANFQTYNFTLNPTLANSSTALIRANSIVLGSNATNISDGSILASDIYVVAINSGPPIASDSQFILMKADPGQLTGLGQGHGSILAQNATVRQGITFTYAVETSIDQANDQVIAIIHGEPQINPQIKALLEGNLSGLSLLTGGADNIANNLSTTIHSQNPPGGLMPVLMLSGNQTRYNSGSMIKSQGTSLIGGLSLQLEQWTLGLFSENSWDSYDSYNEFENAASVHGQGKNRLNGGVFYGHYDFENGGYVDGSLRAGRLHTEFSTGDISNVATGEIAQYMVNRNYIGTHVAGGYIFPLSQYHKLDLNLKYLWARMQATDVVVAGDPMHFDPITSQRLSFNLDNNYQINSQLSLLTGLGYEYEFAGQAQGSSYNMSNIDHPSVKGSTGVATLGVHYQPTVYKRLSLDLKANGYWGKREGGSALLNMHYTF